MTSSLQIALPGRLPTGNRPLQAIICTVVALHVILIGWIAIFGATAPLKKDIPQPRRFVVQTVELNPSPPVSKTINAPAAAPIIPAPLSNPVPEAEKVVEEIPPPKPKETAKASPPPPPKTASPPKTPDAPAPVKKVETKPVDKAKQPPAKKEVKPVQKTPVQKSKAVSKPPVKVSAPVKEASQKPTAAETAKLQELELQKQKEVAKKLERERQVKLLAQAEERIAKIAAGHVKVDAGKGVKAAAVLPGALTSLHIDTLSADSGGIPLSFKEAAYRDELAARLKLQLRLPEYGDVRVKLTLERSGKVVKVVVEGSESSANRKYIEKTLPGVVFPPFGTNFGSDPQYTFSITLSNE